LEEDKVKKQEEILEYSNDFPSKEEEERLNFEKEQAELNFQLSQRKIARRKKILKIVLILFIVAVLAGAVFIIYSRLKNNSAPATPEKKVSIPIPENKDHVFANDVNGIVDENESTTVDDSKGLAGESENYRISDISIGGDTIVLAAETEILPIKVSDVHSETLFSRDQKETKLLVSWKTNKLAQSSVRYAKTGSDEKVLNENSFGFSHALVLNKLDQSSRYSFVVDATDRGGNKASSESFVVYTGSKAVSVFELISSELDSMFSWAIK
jgi:hypothetical protein